MDLTKRKPRNRKIIAYLTANPRYLNKDYGKVADMFGTTVESVRHLAKAIRKEGSVEIPAEETITEKEEEKFSVEEEIMLRRSHAEIKSLREKLDTVIKDYTKLSDTYDMALGLKSKVSDKTPPKIDANPSHKHEATAVISISDGHFEKIVIPSSVNNLNGYNPEVAKKRMERLAENTIKLINKERYDIKIDNLFLDLGGDFIDSSMLHEGSVRQTAMDPLEATMFAKELIAKYITTIAEYGNFKKIIASCVVGNHSRITRKIVPGLNNKLNYEYILYRVLSSEFNDSMFEWHTPEADLSEIEVFGYVIRNQHGHLIKSSGGIGGLAIPLTKQILRQDQNRYADVNLVHHFHTLSYFGNCTVNGSIIGYDPFAMSISAPYQRPLQSFELLDRDRGITMRTPIFCD